MTAQRTKKAAMTTLGDDVRVGIYVRRSTDDEHQPYSIEAQDTRPEAHIGSQPGWRFVARFPDDASGATTEREGLQRALAAAKAGLIDEPRRRSLPAPSFATQQTHFRPGRSRDEIGRTPPRVPEHAGAERAHVGRGERVHHEKARVRNRRAGYRGLDSSGSGRLRIG